MRQLTAFVVSFVLVAAAGYGQEIIFEADFELGDPSGWTLRHDPDLAVTLPGGVQMEFMLIPAGSFLMGSPVSERGRDSSEDLHAVTLTTSYYVGMYEVTQQQWAAIMDLPPWIGCGHFGIGAKYPAYCVSWNELHRSYGFIAKLNAYLVSTSQPAGFRLPTDAEWERAARAGTQTAFSFDTSGNPDWPTWCDYFPEADPYMWWCGNHSIHHAEVGTKLPNGYGLYNMHGNVREWVADWYTRNLGFDGQVDPTGPATGTRRVIRRGMNSSARYNRSAARYSDDPNDYYAHNGFRLARTQQ